MWSVTGFTLSAFVHVLSYFGMAAQESVPLVFALHVGIFPPFFFMITRLNRWRIRTGRFSSQLRWNELRQYFPPWTPVVLVLLGAGSH
jgi:hypothetical protein